MFDRVKDGDKIISDLEPGDMERVHGMQSQFEEFEHYRRRMVRAYNKYQALQVLFWEDMMRKHERCESAAYRGKVLSTCKMNDKLVIVERPAPPDQGPDELQSDQPSI